MGLKHLVACSLQDGNLLEDYVDWKARFMKTILGQLFPKSKEGQTVGPSYMEDLQKQIRTFFSESSAVWESFCHDLATSSSPIHSMHFRGNTRVPHRSRSALYQALPTNMV